MRVARKYNVDFAVKKDNTVEPPKGRTKRNAYCPVLCIALIAAVRCPIRRTTTKAVNPIIRSDATETNGQIDSLALRLCDIAEAMKPGRKKKIPFEPVEIRVICQCLMEWRNREIQAKRHGAVDAINELLIRFTR